MRKTLPKHFIESDKKTAEVVEPGSNSEQLITLMQDMKEVWQEAAGDLMQPRPEAVASLLKKALH